MTARVIEDKVTVAIASGGTQSTAFLPGPYAWGSYQLPAAFTGTAITVQFSNNGTSWTTVPAEGNESNPDTVSQGNTYRLPTMAFSAKFVRLVSGSSEGAARTITIFLKS